MMMRPSITAALALAVLASGCIVSPRLDVTVPAPGADAEAHYQRVGTGRDWWNVTVGEPVRALHANGEPVSFVPLRAAGIDHGGLAYDLAWNLAAHHTSVGDPNEGGSTILLYRIVDYEVPITPASGWGRVVRGGERWTAETPWGPLVTDATLLPGRLVLRSGGWSENRTVEYEFSLPIESPFPRSVLFERPHAPEPRVEYRLAHERRVTDTTLAGPPRAWAAAAAAEELRPWDRFPVDGGSSMPFPFDEAWAWLLRENQGFASYLADHREAFVAYARFRAINETTLVGARGVYVHGGAGHAYWWEVVVTDERGSAYRAYATKRVHAEGTWYQGGYRDIERDQDGPTQLSVVPARALLAASVLTIERAHRIWNVFHAGPNVREFEWTVYPRNEAAAEQGLRPRAGTGPWMTLASGSYTSEYAVDLGHAARVRSAPETVLYLDAATGFASRFSQSGSDWFR